MNLISKTLICASLCGAGAIAAQDGYTNNIRVVEMGGGTDDAMLWDMPGVDAEGNNVLVGEPVPEGGATFLLSTIQTSPFNDFYLSQASVGAYLPKTELRAVTHDTTSHTPRVRADQPFQIEATVSGLYDQSLFNLLGLTNVQQAAQEVRLLQFNQEYADGESSLPGGEITSDSYRELTLYGNGDFPKSSSDLIFYSSLNSSDPLKARGEEHVVARSLDDGGVSGSALDRVIIEVWPVWDGYQDGLVSSQFVPYNYNGADEDIGITGNTTLTVDDDFTPNPNLTSYVSVPPDVTFTWEDLYPTSEIAVIVTDADQTHPWGGVIVPGTRLVYNNNENFDRSLTVVKEQWEQVFSGAGGYNVWMVTNTPGIGWEVAGNYDGGGNLKPGGWYVPITDNVIEIRGSIHSVAE